MSGVVGSFEGWYVLGWSLLTFENVELVPETERLAETGEVCLVWALWFFWHFRVSEKALFFGSKRREKRFEEKKCVEMVFDVYLERARRWLAAVRSFGGESRRASVCLGGRLKKESARASRSRSCSRSCAPVRRAAACGESWLRVCVCVLRRRSGALFVLPLREKEIRDSRETRDTLLQFRELCAGFSVSGYVCAVGAW